MADDLTLTANVDQPIAAFKQLADAYKADLRAMQAAVESGTEVGSAEFEELRQKALASGGAFLKAGQEGVEAMQRLAAATGKPLEGIETLQGQVAELQAQLRQLRTAQAQNAAGADLIGESFDKSAKRVGDFAKAMAGGIVIAELLMPVLKMLEDGVKKGAEEFAKYEIQQIAGGESTTKLGEKTRSLESALSDLTDRTRSQRDAEAEAESARTGYRVTTEKMVEAEKARNEALAAAEKEYQKEAAAARSSNDLLDARDKKLRATEKAQRDYNDAITGERAALEAEVEAGKKFAEGINKSQDAIHAEEAALVGDKKALLEHTSTLLAAIAEVEKHGEVNKQATEKIKTSLADQAAEFKAWGLTVPENLQAVIDKYKLLGETHAATAKTLETPLQPATGTAKADETTKSLQGQQEQLEKTVAALKEKQQTGLTTAADESDLAAAEDNLKDVLRDLHNAQLDATRSAGNLGDVQEKQLTDLQKGQDILSRYGATLDGATGKYDDLTGASQEWLDTLDASTETVTEFAQGMAEAGKTTDEHTRSLSNLNDEELKLLDRLDKQTEGFHNTAEAIEAMQARMDPLKKISPFNDALSETVRLLSTIKELSTDLQDLL